MKLFAGLASFCILVLAVLTAIARGSGANGLFRPQLVLSAGTCNQPCWHGIQVGKTDYSGALETMLGDTRFQVAVNQAPLSLRCDIGWRTNDFPLWRGCVNKGTADRRTLIDDIGIFPDGDLSLAEALLHFGTPSQITYCYSQSGAVPGQFSMRVLFRGDIEAVVISTNQPLQFQIDLSTGISALFYHGPSSASASRGILTGWPGFRRLALITHDCSAA